MLPDHPSKTFLLAVNAHGDPPIVTYVLVGEDVDVRAFMQSDCQRVQPLTAGQPVLY
jgi:hypothetical protein